MSTGFISHEEVLMSIYEFLANFGYRESLLALQAESGVAYNTIHVALTPAGSGGSGAVPTTDTRRSDNKAQARAECSYAPVSREALEAAVLDGNWAEVLHVYVDGLLLPEDVRAMLYETIFEELLEVHGLLPAARALLYNAPALATLKRSAPARFARLEKMLSAFDPATWEEHTKRRAGSVPADAQKRREAVLRALLSVIRFTTEPYLGRLPAALHVAAHRGGAGRKRTRDRGEMEEAGVAHGMDDADGSSAAVRAGSAAAAAASAFLGYPLAAPRTIAARHACVDSSRSVACILALPSATTTATAAPVAIRSEADVVAVGRVDGTVDFLDGRTATPTGPSVSHTQGVLCMCPDAPLAASDDSDSAVCWVAVGYRDGWVKVYNAATHRLARRFPQAHTLGVTCLAFVGNQHPDELGGHHRLILSGSYDATVKLLSLSTGSVVYTVSDTHHGAFVNALCPLPSVTRDAGDDSDEGRGGDRSRVATTTGVVLSAGNDGTLAVWRVHPNAEGIAEEIAEDAEAARRAPPLVTRIGTSMNVRALHADCRDTIATGLTLVAAVATAPGSSAVAAEVVIVTRSAAALVMSLHVELSAEAATGQPVQPTLLCLLRASKPLRHLARVPPPPSSASGPSSVLITADVTDVSGVSSLAPMLSLYATDSEGTLLLYNVEMMWRDEARWRSFGGAVTVVEPSDQSPAVIGEVGHTISDLRVCPLPLHADVAPAVMAFGESLPAMYLLQ